jgi:hypothetical protein
MWFLVALIAVSCAESAGPSETGGGGPEEGDAENILAQPLGDGGVEVSNLREGDLPFAPVVPVSLGAPVRTVVYNTGLEASAVAWVFDDAQLGNFAIVERPDDMSEEGLKREASPVPSPGCTTVQSDNGTGTAVPLTRCAQNNAYVVQLDGGRTALVTAGDSLSVATWIEPLVPSRAPANEANGLNLVVDVMGPTSMFTPDQAVKVANVVATARPD